MEYVWKMISFGSRSSQRPQAIGASGSDPASGSICLEHYFDTLSLSNGYGDVMFTVLVWSQRMATELALIADSTPRNPPAAPTTKPGAMEKAVLDTKAEGGHIITDGTDG